MNAYYRPAGSTATPRYRLDIDPASADWSYSGLRILDLERGQSHVDETGPNEVVVIPLAGSVTVATDPDVAELEGRDSVFSGVTDVAYIPRQRAFSLTSPTGGRFALASARAESNHPFRHVRAGDVQVEMRGAGTCSRQVNNFATPDVLAADRIIACEVLTPGGNWSSFPPHKHDEQRPGESALEEIYYFEVAGGGPAYQRVYGTEARPIDVLAEVRSGDVVLIPHGWHGPSIATPGFDLYYLNVMAGPGAREWLICDDPAYAWIRESWTDQPVDPRLPLTGVTVS